jgi:hypothetical protein
MSAKALVECAFLLPIRRDAQMSDGKFHDPEVWDWLYKELTNRFSFLVRAPGLYERVWKRPETGELLREKSNKIYVAAKLDDLAILREFLAEACKRFHQKTLYLSVAGNVEFLDAAP